MLTQFWLTLFTLYFSKCFRLQLITKVFNGNNEIKKTYMKHSLLEFRFLSLWNFHFPYIYLRNENSRHTHTHTIASLWIRHEPISLFLFIFTALRFPTQKNHRGILSDRRVESSHTVFVFVSLCFPIRYPFFIPNLKGWTITFSERVFYWIPVRCVICTQWFLFRQCVADLVQWDAWDDRDLNENTQKNILISIATVHIKFWKLINSSPDFGELLFGKVFLPLDSIGCFSSPNFIVSKAILNIFMPSFSCPLTWYFSSQSHPFIQSHLLILCAFIYLTILANPTKAK